jgi:hypothetical protein
MIKKYSIAPSTDTVLYTSRASLIFFSVIYAYIVCYLISDEVSLVFSRPSIRSILLKIVLWSAEDNLYSNYSSKSLKITLNSFYLFTNSYFSYSNSDFSILTTVANS